MDVTSEVDALALCELELTRRHRLVESTHYPPTIPQAPSIYYRPSSYLYDRDQQIDREFINTKTHHHTSTPRPHRRGMFFLGA
jgi:hypothetical protein